MESGSGGRADGRGWGGRGDSGARRGATDDDVRIPREPRVTRDPRGPRELGEEELLRGSGEAPWVRLGDPGRRPGEAPGAERGGPPLPDLSALLAVLEGARGMVPPELSTQAKALVREVLLTLRALIDWYLERLDGGPREPEVEDIPID